MKKGFKEYGMLGLYRLHPFGAVVWLWVCYREECSLNIRAYACGTYPEDRLKRMNLLIVVKGVNPEN